MSTPEFNLDDILASIMDPSQPLPVVEEKVESTAVDPAPTPDEAIVQEAEAETTNLEDLINDEEPISSEDLLPFKDSADNEEAKYALPPVITPKFTDEEIAKTLDIRNFATLVTLTCTRWQGKVKDRKASRDAAAASGADEHAFETRKNLLVGADEKLKKIHKILDQARADHYEMTVPWTTTGVQDGGRRAGARLLPNTSFFDYCGKLGTHKNDLKAALDDFLPEYPAMVEQAKAKLGKSFDIRDYPSAEELKRRFGMGFDFQPIPAGEDFKGLPGQQCQALADKLAEKTTTMVENAMQDLWARIHKNVGRMVERLSHPDKMFHTSLVENVRGVAQQLRHLNVTGDKDIESLRQYIEKHLCQHDAEEIRKNPTLRTQIAASAEQTIHMMNEIGGRRQ